MTHRLADPVFVFNALSAVFYVLLGAWVLTLTPRRRQTTLLGVYAVLLGLRFLVLRVRELLDYVPEAGLLATSVIAMSFEIGASLAVLGLAWTVAQPLEDRRLLGIALAAGVVASLLRMAMLLVRGFLADIGGPLFVPGEFTENAFERAAVFLLVLRAHPARRPGRDQVIQLALLAVAVALVGGWVRGLDIVSAAGLLARGEVGAGLVTVATTGVWLVLAGLWGWNMLRADEETVRIHRAAMLGILGLLTVGAFYGLAFPENSVAAELASGVSLTLGVGLLAYGVLRHDLAGLDEKVEYGISKTTVAGVFVAVFFGASEAAQVLFADFAGNELIGVAAAALLVFAISPLQRFADRFAAKAVPGGAEAGAGAEERFRKAVDLALADGQISREEERRLAERADELGLSHARARQLREQVEDEAGGGGQA